MNISLIIWIYCCIFEIGLFSFCSVVFLPVCLSDHIFYSVCETLTLLMAFSSSLFLRIRLRYLLILLICFVRLMLDFMINGTVKRLIYE